MSLHDARFQEELDAFDLYDRMLWQERPVAGDRRGPFDPSAGLDLSPVPVGAFYHSESQRVPEAVAWGVWD